MDVCFSHALAVVSVTIQRRVLCFAMVAAVAGAVPSLAWPAPFRDAEVSCLVAADHAERAEHLPTGLLAAVFTVETGRRDTSSGQIAPWPWTINVEGVDHIFPSKAEAVAATYVFQAAGTRSIDVGCGQVNLMFHPDAFKSLEQAFDPAANAAYAGHFLRTLFDQTGDWSRASAAYHSLTPNLGADYERKVMASWSAQGPARVGPPRAEPRPVTEVGETFLAVGATAIRSRSAPRAEPAFTTRSVQPRPVSALPVVLR